MTSEQKIKEIERLLEELWTDSNYITIQLPGQEGAGPYIFRDAMSDGGWYYSDGTCNGRAVEYD